MLVSAASCVPPRQGVDRVSQAVPPPTPPYAPIVYIQSHSPRGSGGGTETAGGGLAISLVVLCGCCGLCSTVWKSRRRRDRRTPPSAYATVPTGALPQLP